MRLILWLALLLTAGSYICGPVVDPDLWWHITVGRWIISHKQIPVADHWNMYGLDQPWRAYSWACEILFASVDARFGIQGLWTLQLFVTWLIAFSLFFCLGKISRDWFVGGLLGFYATVATFDHFTLRPQSFVWVYFICLIYAADLVARDGFNLRRGLALAAVMMFWANTHITSVLGLSVVVAWVWSARGTRDTLKAAGTAFAGTLITPYRGGEWLTFLSKTGHPFSHASIAEFQPATIMQYSTSFLVIIAFVLINFFFKRPAAFHPLRLLIAGGFVLGSLAVVKFLPFAVILLCAMVAVFWREESAKPDNVDVPLIEAVHKFSALFDRIPREGLTFVFLCLTSLNVYKTAKSPLNLDIVPESAVDFIIEHKLPHPMLNGFGQGGYMMYRFSDADGNLAHPVPIDGRTNVMPQHVWEKFDASLRGTHRWHEFIDLVKPETILWKTESPLTSILLSGKEWCSVFRSGTPDAGYTVFLKADKFWPLASELKSENCAGT